MNRDRWRLTSGGLVVAGLALVVLLAGGAARGRPRGDRWVVVVALVALLALVVALGPGCAASPVPDSLPSLGRPWLPSLGAGLAEVVG